MREYIIGPEGIDEVRRRTTALVIVLTMLITGFGPYTSRVRFNHWTGYAFIAIVVGITILAILKGFRRQREMLEKYRVIVDERSVTVRAEFLGM